jgi:hypothetical protein
LANLYGGFLPPFLFGCKLKKRLTEISITPDFLHKNFLFEDYKANEIFRLYFQPQLDKVKLLGYDCDIQISLEYKISCDWYVGYIDLIYEDEVALIWWELTTK